MGATGSTLPNQSSAALLAKRRRVNMRKVLPELDRAASPNVIETVVKKSSKKNDPKLFDDQHVEDVISKAPVAAHSMLKVSYPNSFLRYNTYNFLEHHESTAGLSRARTRRVRQCHRYRQTRPRQTWTEEVRAIECIRVPSLMRTATHSVRVKCDVVKVRKPVIEARLAPKQAQQIKSVRTESDSSPIKLGSFIPSFRLRYGVHLA